jgi:hypothetical protein
VPPWRVKGILPAEGLATIYGPSGSGKSFLSIDLAISIAIGNDWFNHRVRQSPVMYVALEGEVGFPKRIKAWKLANECNIPDSLHWVTGQPFRLNDPGSVRGLAALIKRTLGMGCVVVIDTLNRSAPDADENNSKDMGAILHGCKLLQRLVKGLIILVHHTGKDVTKGLRGHSSLLAAMDAAIEVLRDEDVRSWSVAKAKDDIDGSTLGFRLNVQYLGTDEDGDAITSCAIEPATELATPRKKSLKGNQKLVYDAIVARLQTGCGLLDYEEALRLAIEALTSTVDPKHRSDRAGYALNSLLKSHKLVRDPDAPAMISLP